MSGVDTARLRGPGQRVSLPSIVARDIADELDALREALPKDPYRWDFETSDYRCYGCGLCRHETHAPDCAWSKAMALRGEG